MSDTKTLIKYVRDCIKYGPNIAFDNPTVCNLVEALEASEHRADKLKADIDAGAKDYCALMDRHDAQFVHAKKAEANVERLNKMVDWLADKLSDHCLADGGDCNIQICPTYIACRNATPEVWKEAANRAVAESEVKG